MKHLYLSTTDKRISGVCGGIAEYLEADATVIRLLWVVITVISGVVPGILAYIIMAVITPKPGESTTSTKQP